MDGAERSRIGRIFGVIDVIAALLTALGVFAGLPARWWPVDIAGALVIALFGAAGVGLLMRAPWGERAARIASFVTLGLGLVLIGILVITASYLSGIYGAVGRGGAIIFALVAGLALPYLVALPASQLLWLGVRASSPSSPSHSSPSSPSHPESAGADREDSAP